MINLVIVSYLILGALHAGAFLIFSLPNHDYVYDKPYYFVMTTLTWPAVWYFLVRKVVKGYHQ